MKTFTYFVKNPLWVLILFAVCGVSFFSACTKEDESSLNGISFEKDEISLTVGDTCRLEVILSPSDAEADLEWDSSAPDIASVQDGLVTALASGNTTITVSSGELMAQCSISVSEEEQGVSIELNHIECTLERGETLQLTATVSPEIPSGATVQWSSSDPEVVTVDEEGMVTAVNKGQATVTAQYDTASAECKIEVVGKSVESITLDQTSIDLTVGDSYTLTATVSPEDADDIVLEWDSSDGNVATVTDGTVTAVSDGTCTITVSCQGESAACEVNVTSVQLPDPILGDFYYSDGTWSSELDNSKTAIGVVFYTGDPAKDDGILRSEHPDCTHGLVISIRRHTGPWQFNCYDYNASINDWVSANLSGYESMFGGNTGNDGNLNKMLGYQYTKAIKAFNEDPSHADYPVEVVSNISAFETDTPAPAGTSGWYLPSVKEVSLIITGDGYDNIYDIFGDTENTDVINASLARIEGADTIVGGTNTYYWSSTEHYESSPLQAYAVYADYGMVSPYLKLYEASYYYILAF